MQINEYSLVLIPQPATGQALMSHSVQWRFVIKETSITRTSSCSTVYNIIPLLLLLLLFFNAGLVWFNSPCFFCPSLLICRVSLAYKALSWWWGVENSTERVSSASYSYCAGSPTATTVDGFAESRGLWWGSATLCLPTHWSQEASPRTQTLPPQRKKKKTWFGKHWDKTISSWLAEEGASVKVKSHSDNCAHSAGAGEKRWALLCLDWALFSGSRSPQWRDLPGCSYSERRWLFECHCCQEFEGCGLFTQPGLAWKQNTSQPIWRAAVFSCMPVVPLVQASPLSSSLYRFLFL